MDGKSHIKAFEYLKKCKLNQKNSICFCEETIHSFNSSAMGGTT